MSDLSEIYAISGSGLRAQTERLRVIAENIANANTTPSQPGAVPYQRRVVTFKNEFDRAMGVDKVKVSGVVKDKSTFGKKYEPAHPAADANGYVLTSNVKPVIEHLDMRDAERSYEANLSVIDASRVMMLRTIDIIR